MNLRQLAAMPWWIADLTVVTIFGEVWYSSRRRWRWNVAVHNWMYHLTEDWDEAYGAAYPGW